MEGKLSVLFKTLLITLILSALTEFHILFLERGLANVDYTKVEHRNKLFRVKVIMLYDRITDGKLFNRDYEDIVQLLRETGTDFIFLGFERAKPLPLAPDETYNHFSSRQLRYFAKIGLTYKQFEEAIREIKRELPDIIICGGILPQYIYSRERDPITLEIFDRDETWEMALDPEKWGIPVSKEKLQAKIGIREGKGIVSDPKNELSTFYPDITNPKYQRLLIDWAKKQIDCGVDALWFDMLLGQVNILKRLLVQQGLTEEEAYNHPALRESYTAVLKVLREIRRYGYEKYNRHIYIGMWATIADVPYPVPDLDFIYISPMNREEILNLTIDEEKWDEKFSKIRERFGRDIPIYVYISWGHTTRTQLGAFSQELSKEEQREYMKLVDSFCRSRGVNFVYPLHGGFMGIDAKILSYGKYPIYDSLAPEFDTYDTIRELARQKKSERESLRGNSLRRLRKVKVAVWYQYLTGGRVVGRSDEEAVKILKDLGVDLVRGWWRWQPIPFSPHDEQFLRTFRREKFDRFVLTGQTWQDYENIVKLFREKLPDSIFLASFGLQFIPRAKDRDPVTGEIIDRERAWKMAFDPRRHGFKMSKAKYQCIQAKRRGWVRKDIKCEEVSEDFVKSNLSVYWGDPTDEDWQELTFHIAQRLIDGGADAIWIDMYLKPSVSVIALHCLEEQGTIDDCDFDRALRDERVREIINAQKRFIDRIHRYGLSRGKYVLIGSWGVLGKIKAPQQGILLKGLVPNYDFVVTTISSEEIYSREIDVERWERIIKRHREIFGDIPMFVWFDTGYYSSPMHIFSQYLDKNEQAEFLKKADKFFIELSRREDIPIVFVYPVSGQMMGPWKEGERKVLSFQCCCDTCRDKCLVTGDREGECGFGSYDSLAPEFETYETIRELAHQKKKEERSDPVSTSWINEPLFEMIQLSRNGILTFKEQEKMLPILAEMGIKTVYLTPIWETCEEPGRLRRYCIENYYKIDHRKGTEKDLKEFVERAHSYGIRVILDLVTAHTGPGRYIYENHKDWILKDKYGRLAFCWPSKYWGYAIDRANPDVIRYFTEIARYYVDRFGIDGWRVDAIGTQYCNESVPNCPQPVEGEHHSKPLLRSIKSVLGEGRALYLEWGYLGRIYLFEAGVEERGGCPYPNPIPCSMALPELNEQADASYSYEFGKCFMREVLAGKISSRDFVNFFKNECLYYGKRRGRFLMTHDFGYQFYADHPKLHRLGAILITTVPGFPHIYHREIFTEGDVNSIDQEMFNLYRKLLSIRENSRALRDGEIEDIWRGGDSVIAYLRRYEDEKVVVIVNFSNRTAVSTLDLSFFPKGTVLHDELSNENFTIDEPSNFRISLPPYGGRLLIPVTEVD